ncbi:MAG: hypothetical protein HY680_04390 [Chloroflexi bacterium]|nr:hypothetical protein [Chloroflexota bacterium]
MRTEKAAFSGWETIMLMGPLPALAAAAAMVLVEGIPLFTVLAVALIAYGVLFVGVTEARRAAAAESLAQQRPDLELVDMVPTHAFAAIQVTRTMGVCPLGFQEGHTWELADGHLSHPLCRPAAAALSGVLANGGQRSAVALAHCHCPLGMRDVAFTVASRAA